MKKVLLVPDSFKGTMSSREICAIMAEEVRHIFPAAQVQSIPVADGGEGSVETFLEALGGEKRFIACQGPFGEAVQGFYGMLPDGKTAVVEMAAAAGLPLAHGRMNPEKTTTYGVGQLLAAAHLDGAEKIIVGLGGSATNDGGCGAAAAVGVRFYRADGTVFIPTGGTLTDIDRIDASAHLLQGTELVYMCDIDNPLCGEWGGGGVCSPKGSRCGGGRAVGRRAAPPCGTDSPGFGQGYFGFARCGSRRRHGRRVLGPIGRTSANGD